MQDDPDSQKGAPKGPLVWDVPVRIMHWTLVLAVAGAWASQKLPGDWFRYHVWCGYVVIVTVATRLLWGIVGTRHARFASFVKGPAAMIAYGRSLLSRGAEAATPGHNPLGAVMVLLLLALLLVQALTGLFADDEVMNTGPLVAYVTSSRSGKLTHVHALVAWWMLGAIALHVAAALFYLAIKRENLIRPMFTGRRPAGRVSAEESIRSSLTARALLIAAVAAAVLAIVVVTAPA